MTGPFAVLRPPASLGVVGSGQLGRMFVQAAERMGYRTGVLCAHEDDPAAQVAHWSVTGRADDLSALRKFAAQADAITVEFENVSAAGLRWLERLRPVRPSWFAIWTSQNRLREKRFLSRHGVPVAPWMPVRSPDELATARGRLPFPWILKTAVSGYDGKGQIRVESATEASSAWERLGKVACVAEGVVDFAVEVSAVVVRSHSGQALAYPVCLNRHVNHILDSTVAPAPIGPVASQEAQGLALSIAEALAYVGVLTVEFFLTADGRLYVNELAPRPHNSGHLTIEAAFTSQFEQQVRALCGLPLGRAELAMPGAMVNLLGDLWAAGEPSWEAALASDPGVKLHLYGKRFAKPGRKMGHLTVLDRDPDSALLLALAARHRLASR